MKFFGLLFLVYSLSANATLELTCEDISKEWIPAKSIGKVSCTLENTGKATDHYWHLISNNCDYFEVNRIDFKNKRVFNHSMSPKEKRKFDVQCKFKHEGDFESKVWAVQNGSKVQAVIKAQVRNRTHNCHDFRYVNFGEGSKFPVCQMEAALSRLNHQSTDWKYQSENFCENKIKLEELKKVKAVDEKYSTLNKKMKNKIINEIHECLDKKSESCLSYAIGFCSGWMKNSKDCLGLAGAILGRRLNKEKNQCEYLVYSSDSELSQFEKVEADSAGKLFWVDIDTFESHLKEVIFLGKK
jgi:hypothetical protein